MKYDKTTNEYVEKMKAMKLSESSRARIQADLLAHARFHGVRVEGESRSIEQVPQRTSLFTLFTQPKFMTAAIITIALIVGGGTSYAAEGAVPGDFLYTVKTEVNENIKSALAVSDEAEARLQARLVEERLAEAETLAARGELSAETSVALSSRVKAHATEAEERSAEAEADGDYESSAAVRASLEGSMRAYADILTDLQTQVSGNDSTALITDIRAYAGAAASAQVNATATMETSVDVKVIAEAAIDQADRMIDMLSAKLERAKAEMSAEAYARAEASVNDAIAAQVEAKAAFRAEAYREAYTMTQTATRYVAEAETKITSALRVDIQTATDARVETGVVDVSLDAVTTTRTESETAAEANETETSETSTDTRTDSTVEVEGSAEVKVPVLDSAVEATGAVDIGAGATNAIDYNSSRSNKNF